MFGMIISRLLLFSPDAINGLLFGYFFNVCHILLLFRHIQMPGHTELKLCPVIANYVSSMDRIILMDHVEV